MAVASNSYTHTTWVRFWESGSLVVMFEADSHLKLIPATRLVIYKVFEHIDMQSIGIWQ